MKKKILTISIILAVFLLTGCASNSSPAVKKSDTGICHEEGTNYYKNTKNFTSYDSIDECLNSGGRLPKK